MTDLVHRHPDEEGEFESGCHYNKSNNMALSAQCDSGWYNHAMVLCAGWNEARRACVLKDVSGYMFGWLLERADALLDKAFRLSMESRINDNERRDWLCWLHRWMYNTAKETYAK